MGLRDRGWIENPPPPTRRRVPGGGQNMPPPPEPPPLRIINEGQELPMPKPRPINADLLLSILRGVHLTPTQREALGLESDWLERLDKAFLELVAEVVEKNKDLLRMLASR